MSETHQILEEGNRTPKAVQTIIEEYMAREPAPPRGRRIALGVTLLREVDAKAHLRWEQVLRSHWWPGPIFNGRGQYTVQGRNLVLKQAFAELDAWDDLLFWDADQVPPLVVPGPLPNGWAGGWFTDYIDYLSEHEKDKDVIGGLYFSREDYWQTDETGAIKAGPHEPVAYGSSGENTYRYLTPAELVPMMQRPDLYPVKAVGTGSMLIRKELLLELAALKAPKAIFEAPELKPGELGGVVGSQWTEDVYFCHEVQTKLHKTIWLDSAMQSAHIAEIWITGAHYLEARGFGTQPHEQSFRAENHAKENERRKSRIIVPGR